MGDFFQPWHLILLLIVSSFLTVLYVVPFWFIYKKAGFTPWLCALCIIPFGTVISLFILAFAEWPLQRPPIRGGYVPPLPPQL